jgi:predicted O-methyltransferase YrrM
MYNPTVLESFWQTALGSFKIQQIREEWLWLVDQTVNRWDRPGHILEIGCYDGGSTFFLGNFAENMVTVDMHKKPRFDPSKIPAKNYRYHGGDSHAPAQTRHFSKHSWDFVLIDGDHSYEGVKADFENILPHLRPGIPVAFHDIAISRSHHEQGCFVGEFWNDLKARYPQAGFEEIRTHPDWAGIGIIRL